MSIPPPHGPSQEPQDPQGRRPDPRRPAPWGRAPYPPPLSTHGGPSGFAPYGLYGPYGPRPPAVGWDVTDPYVSVTARHALGLTATPPEYDEEAERDTDGGGMKV
ncbi:hypothetical protein KYY02_02575 [Streptomyces pimonensis]|uniref:Uncharacterized protein n=1 Tax=Streptomyces pimonensis TaxID=2860288 RepID=A0ABV4ISI7_9ACTN